MKTNEQSTIKELSEALKSLLGNNCHCDTDVDKETGSVPSGGTVNWHGEYT